VTAVLGHGKFQMDEFGGITGEDILANAPALSLPQAEFTCPLQAGIQENVGFAGTSCNSIINPCFAQCNAVALLASRCRSKVSIGGSTEFTPSNAAKMTIQSRSDVEYSGLAITVVGYAQFNVKIGLRLSNANGYDKREILHNKWAIAPILYFKTIDFEATDFVMGHQFSGNFPSSLYSAQVYLEAFALGIGDSGGDGFCKTELIDFVKISN
jgi:hypothetical protein